jgi:hypothetical protein
MVKVTMEQRKAAIAEKAKADKAAKYKAFADASKECEALLNHPATMADTLAYMELQKKIEKESARAEEFELLKLRLLQGVYPYAEWETEEGNYVGACCVDKWPFSVLPFVSDLECCKPGYVCHIKPCCKCNCNCCKDCCKPTDCYKPYGIEIGCLHVHCAKYPSCLSVSAASQHFRSP